MKILTTVSRDFFGEGLCLDLKELGFCACGDAADVYIGGSVSAVKACRTTKVSPQGAEGY